MQLSPCDLRQDQQRISKIEFRFAGLPAELASVLAVTLNSDLATLPAIQLAMLLVAVNQKK